MKNITVDIFNIFCPKIKLLNDYLEKMVSDYKTKILKKYNVEDDLNFMSPFIVNRVIVNYIENIIEDEIFNTIMKDFIFDTNLWVYN